MIELCETMPQNESTMSFVLAIIFVVFLGVDTVVNVWSLVEYVELAKKSRALRASSQIDGNCSTLISSASAAARPPMGRQPYFYKPV